MKALLVLLLALLATPACGDDCRMSRSVLAGTWTEEEARGLVEVVEALKCAGYADPGFYVIFVHSVEQAEDCHMPGSRARPGEYVWGATKPADCVIWLRRFDCDGRDWKRDLAHEMLHGLGYGEQEVKRHVKGVVKCLNTKY